MAITRKQAAKILLAKRQAEKGAKPFLLEEFLFPEQLAFVTDPSPNKLAVCSRRAGKTTACAADLVKTAITDSEVVCLYITLSRNNAKKIIWRELNRINRDYGLGGMTNMAELSIAFPNGSIIYLSGAKDAGEIEKFRGLAIKLCYIDEAQSFREYIKELIDDVISPALMDYAGTLCLTGTPGPVPTGYFHDCAVKSKSWSKHYWTFWNNPFLVKKSKLSHQQQLDRELKRRGVSAGDPSIQREYFGKWVLDSDSLLLHYNSELNNFDFLPALNPPHKYHYIMGIDLGFNDADAIAIIAWSEGSPVTYLVEEVITAKQGITELVTQIQDLLKLYQVDKIVMDEGGLGKKIAEEIRRQKNIPVQGADKKLKMQNVAFLNDAMKTGRFRASGTSRFAQDCYLVEIDWARSTPDRIRVSSKYHSDAIDATLYAFKESPAYTYEPPVSKLVEGTREWAAAEAEKMFNTEMDAAIERAQQEKYNSGEFDW